MSNLFISYATPELDIARGLQQRLIDKGHRVRIPVGSAVAGTWRPKFTKALGASDVLIVILGDAGLASKSVLGEIGAGRVQEQARGMLLLPVLVKITLIPDFISDIYCFRLPTTADSDLNDMADQLDRAITDSVRISPRIFISHRHRDKPIAAGLTALLEHGFNIERNDIRCTSVPPYMLAPGERTSEQLRSDIAGAELVIGILSPDTSESNYVLCELGASWGRDVPTFPVLVRGATFADVPSPLNERHSISLEKEESCIQLIDYVASKTTLRRREPPPDDLAKQAARLAAEAKSQVNVKSEWEHSHPDNYTGPVWTKLQALDEGRSVSYRVFIRWGRLVYVAELSIPPNGHVYLTHERTRPDLVPIYVHVSPPCQVLFGQGKPPDGTAFDIRSGWQELKHPAG